MKCAWEFVLSGISFFINHVKFKDMGKTRFVCHECGSENIEIKAWVAPNRNNEYVEDCEDTPECWCNECHQRVKMDIKDLSTDLNN